MPISANRPAPAPVLPLDTAPPPPETPTCKVPTKRILSTEDHALFTASSTHNLVFGFVNDLNTAVLNRPNSFKCHTSPFLQHVLDILDLVEELHGQHPPEDVGLSRFGNKAFQKFYDDLQTKAGQWHKEKLGLTQEQTDEVEKYFCEAWGNRTRIDYGSGHELNFLCWILCFRQLKLLSVPDYPAIVLRVFTRYLKIMRKLQTTYYLEPAGSHGVWGLDDYQFLPFLFGSAQLYSHPHIRPKSIHNEDLLDEYASEYIYLGCIAFINSIKTTAKLRWHSPMLDDISAAKNWGKINAGMIKMYDKEVLGKLPVMQHFMFGGLIPAVEGMSEEREEVEGESSEPEVRIIEGEDGKKIVIDRDGMRHVHSTWGECCGIKVPSAAGARKQEEEKALRRVPRIPFD